MVESPAHTTEENKHPPLRGPSPVAEETPVVEGSLTHL